ncbi:MAG: DUF899 family protein [Thalassobaculaceae bacterium]|nr:DUF899 family protein [Thalassobaculaceae bacterium]
MQKIVSREEWLAARRSPDARTRGGHLRDAASAERRALPWVRVETTYVFDAPEGTATLADLFDGRRQLFVQHFMLPPGGPICNGCAGAVFHTYSAYTRGTELVFTPFPFLDMTPRGRNEAAGTMSWLRLHDEYETVSAKACCHGSDAAE